ncbi:MAG TPA: alpha/beta fold hydrolase [Lacipirellulaceae bacterium]|nr:alpha/beta fold hydrolase [Lacipirellulaceae bacterium]
MAPANRDVGAPPADLPVESLTLSSRSGSQVAAWYIPATQAQATVVLVHGIHADRRIMLGRARALHEAGYATLLIDLQAHGESPGQVITLGYLERHDVQAAVELARRREPDHRIGLIGVSMGGAAALLAPELKLDALVLESVYATMDDAIGNRVRLACGPLAPLVTPLMCRQFGPRLGISTADLRPIDHIGRVGCPVMVVTGEDDAFTPVAESRRMYDAAADPKQFVVFEDVGHADFLAHDAAAYRATVLAFLTKHLAPAAE